MCIKIKQLIYNIINERWNTVKTITVKSNAGVLKLGLYLRVCMCVGVFEGVTVPKLYKFVDKKSNILQIKYGLIKCFIISLEGQDIF